MNVYIYGAGSIGNHLAHGCRNKSWEVWMADPDPEALRRTREDIYPSRYGSWDESIRLCMPDELQGAADLVVIGTPPDLHMDIALEVLRKAAPRAMLIEKPLCTPDLKGLAQLVQASKAAGTQVLTGYNHTCARNTKVAEDILKTGVLGSPVSLNVRWLEHWGGIFGAHPWLSGPQDSYLGDYRRGGGACGEHSHGINIFLHFAEVLGLGPVESVSSMMDVVDEDSCCHDRVFHASLKTRSGLVGTVSQDVVTQPAVKTIRMQGERGFMEWYAGYDSQHDAVIWGENGKEPQTELIPKTRPKDFEGELDEVERLLRSGASSSPISLEQGIHTMKVIAASYRSHQEGRVMNLSEITI
jgi:predicted dehydrogenase